MEIIDINNKETKEESLQVLRAGFTKIHRMLRISLDEETPKEYYDEINKMFNGQPVEIFIETVKKILAEYRDYHMPNARVFSIAMVEVIRTNKHLQIALPHHEEQESSEEAKECLAQLIQKFKDENPHLVADENKKESNRTRRIT